MPSRDPGRGGRCRPSSAPARDRRPSKDDDKVAGPNSPPSRSDVEARADAVLAIEKLLICLRLEPEALLPVLHAPVRALPDLVAGQHETLRSLAQHPLADDDVLCDEDRKSLAERDRHGVRERLHLDGEEPPAGLAVREDV